MNEIANKFLLAEDKFMFKIRLRQPGYTHSACGSFTKNKGRIQKLKKNRRYTIYQNHCVKFVQIWSSFWSTRTP